MLGKTWYMINGTISPIEPSLITPNRHLFGYISHKNYGAYEVENIITIMIWLFWNYTTDIFTGRTAIGLENLDHKVLM